MNRKENGGCMQAESENQSEKIWKIIAFTGLLLCAGLAVWGYQSGYFHSADSLQKFIMQFGGLGMALFIAIQIVQVVFPILPGGISCLAGVMLYGPWIGFLCNYIGICIGSMAAFAIARNLGRAAFEKKFSQKQIQKFEKWTDQGKRFYKLFAAAIFFPVAPDDLLCYLAGTTKMTWKQFVIIIWLGKPFSIALYSMGIVKLSRILLP